MVSSLSSRPRRAVALAIAFCLALLTLASGTTAARADVTSVTLVGSLQSELGCAKDWQEDCSASHLTLGEGGRWAATYTVPAGSYEYKVTLNDAWDENYGANGAANGANIPLVLLADAEVRFSYDQASHLVTATPVDLAGGTTASDKALARASLRKALTKENFYFVMADRFANGSKRNDKGGLRGDRLSTGFDPTDKGFYHGGDLSGLTDRLDYIKGLGTTAIWLTPSFKNSPVQGSGADASAGYHGYWITDFTQIDPHLGTNAEMKKLIKAAHKRGMKVFFDIITNHTADVIRYADNDYGYVSKEAEPYLDAAGQAFDDRDYIVGNAFPAMDPATSFPHPPTFANPGDAKVKVPSWLNDPTMYHNRGDTTWTGESSTYGDFVGLDDVFTERPEVVQGFIDIYNTWVGMGIDGFRIDTVKHVNIEFWQQFSPAVLSHAATIGNKDFFMFGEVYDSSPSYLSTFTTEGKLQATLDFGFQGTAAGFVQGAPTIGAREFFAADDYYTDTDSNAYQLPTFTGNHDMGRLSMMLSKAGYSGDDLMKRVQLANALMYTTRGNPVTYYGDEQGFIGAGGDKDSRQDMFATKTAQYASEPVLGAASGSRNRYDRKHPLYREIAALATLRRKHPGLANGAQIHRYASSEAGIYAFSRIDAASGTEYVVAVNNATQAQQATFATYNANENFKPLYGTTKKLRSAKDARVSVTVPALSAVVWKASTRLDRPAEAPDLRFTASAGSVVGGRAAITAESTSAAFQQVSFWYRPVGTSEWLYVGTDDNGPYRVFHDVSGMAFGTLLEYRAVTRDSAGQIAATSTWGVVGQPASTPGGGGGGNTGTVEQPDHVSVPGSLNSEMGCAEDWAPGCEQAQLSFDSNDLIWKASFPLPAGEYEYKAAIDKSWSENYGAGGVRDGSNIALTTEGQPVRFYYDHATHYVTTDAQGPIITTPGSWNSELGCSEDWQATCMRPWLQDPDGDGTFTWSSSLIPAGSYEFKVAHGLAWDENYGADGEPNGSNIVATLTEGSTVTISYVLATHQATVTLGTAGSGPDLGVDKAVWVEPGLIAWPATGIDDPRYRQFRLFWGGDVALDAETIISARSATLNYDPAGLPADVVAAHPDLDGYLALRVDARTAAKREAILAGEAAVGVFDTNGRLIDAGGVR